MNCFKKRAALLIICVFVLIFNSIAQVSKHGKVIGQNNKGIESVTVFKNKILMTLTDHDGDFNLSELKVGDRLSFSAVGYEDSIWVLDKKNEGEQLLIKLKDKYNLLDDVEIYSPDFVKRLINDCLKNRADSGVINKEILCRQYMKRNGAFTNFAEGIFHLSMTADEKNVKLYLLSNRNLKDLTLDKPALPKIHYAIVLKDELRNYFRYYKTEFKPDPDYEYSVEGKVNYRGSICYKVVYSKVRNVKTRNRNGLIYITVDKHLIKGLESNVVATNKGRVWTINQAYEIEDNLSTLSTTYLKCGIVSGHFAKGEPSGEMELFFLKKVTNDRPDKNDFSNSKLKQDLYKYPYQYDSKTWKTYYEKYHLRLPAQILEDYKLKDDAAAEFEFSGKRLID